MSPGRLLSGSVLGLLGLALLAGCVRSPQAQSEPQSGPPATRLITTGPISGAPMPLAEGLQGGVVGGPVRLQRDLSDVGGELFFPGAHTDEEAVARDVALLLDLGVPEFDRPIDPEDAPEAKILAMGSVSDELKWMLTLPGLEPGDLRPVTRPAAVPDCEVKVDDHDPALRYATTRLAIQISHLEREDEPEANLPNPPEGFELLDASAPLPGEVSAWEGHTLLYADRDAHTRTLLVCPDTQSVMDIDLDLKAGWNLLQVRESTGENGDIRSVHRILPLKTPIPLRGVH